MAESQRLHIKRVRGKKDMEAFIRLPWSIYSKDPNWVPPVMQETRMRLSPKNPYFRHADARFWIAFRQNRVVGRISAQIDRLHLGRYADSTGFWGMLEAEDSREIFSALLETAEGWLCSRGMKRARGPYNLSVNQECGLLVKGFEFPPSMMMGHASSYYAQRLEELGYVKAKDLIAYSIDKAPDTIRRIEKILGRQRDQFQTRPLNKKNLSAELDTMFSIFNDAWSENWGYLPFTRQEYMDTGKSMSLLAKPDFIRIAEIQGKPAGFIVLLPNLNEITRDLNGRLLPLGWIKLLWRIRFHRFQSGRILLMGVLKKYQESLAGAAVSLCLIKDVMKEVLKTDINQIELSWILEDNMAMRRIIEALGAKPYKIYRIYEKTLTPQAASNGKRPV